ncbi:hypothetical protein MHH28_07790 [Paenibacillus sp. FSL K6-1217]|uniref:hypothetical protein n=1 Tax=Paenibacillus sp. FSL K6-1217 TaxID=2921466 RepID=UPI003251B790
MTQVQTMTNPELNRALAELMGYTVRTYRNGKSVLIGPNLRIVSAKECFPAEVWEDAPNYCTDPAASLEVQTAAIADNKLVYLNTLLSMVNPFEDIESAYGGELKVVGYTIDGTSALLTASPRERAEAAYITLQGAQNERNNR